jgi:hypothetical protein
MKYFYVIIIDPYFIINKSFEKLFQGYTVSSFIFNNSIQMIELI